MIAQSDHAAAAGLAHENPTRVARMLWPTRVGLWAEHPRERSVALFASDWALASCSTETPDLVVRYLG